MSDNDRPAERRTVLQMIGASAGVSALPVATARGASQSDRSKDELVREVRQSETYEALRKELSDDNVVPRLDEATAQQATAQRTEQGYLLYVPTESASRDAAEPRVGAAVTGDDVTTFAEISDGSGRKYHVSNRAAMSRLDDDVFTSSIVQPEELDSTLPSHLTDNVRSGGSDIGIQNHLNDYWVIRYGWNYKGTYDEDTVCDLIDGADALIAVAALLLNDISGVGVVDDYLIPAIGLGAAGCALENLAEEYLSGYLNCDSYTWVYEVYMPAWWNTQGPIIMPKCK